MKVFINEKNEIKAIDISDDKTLIEIEVDRDEVFGTMSDFRILHYSIKKLENNIVITYPTIDTELLDKLEIDYLIGAQSKKIDILEAENNRLREVEKEQDKMIMDNAYKMTILESNMGGM